MKAVRRGEVDRSDWNAVCETSRQAWLFHRWEWIRIEEMHFDRVDRSFALSQAGKIIALQPLYIETYSVGSWVEKMVNCGIHRHTGLALTDGLPVSEGKAARTASIRRIMEVAEECDADRIFLNSHNLTPENRSTDREEIPFWVTDHDFRLGLAFGPFGMMPAPGLTTCGADQVVDLRASERNLFERIDPSARRAIRKAERHGLTMRVAKDASCIDDYYALARDSARRTGEDLPKQEYYKDVWSAFSNSGHIVVLFAEHGGIPVAGLILLIDKAAASFFAGVSRVGALHLRVNDFLHWAAIRWAREHGLVCYRFGPSFPEVPRDWPISRVSRFKTKFGGRVQTVIQGSHFRHPWKYRNVAENHLEWLFEATGTANAASTS